MRVTNGHSVNTYLRNLESVQNDKYKDEIRLSTGKNIVNLSDAPDKLVRVKTLDASIKQNDNYRLIIDHTIREMAAAEDRVQSISNKIAEIRQLAIEATHAGSSGNTFTVGTYVKGLLEDIMKDANADFNGKLLFSGTKTTAESIAPAPPQKDSLPFEMLTGEPTPQNQSGLSVVFKGNFNDRIINKDSKTTEVINSTADELFGTNGTEFFNDIVKLYNVLTFKADGTTRGVGDALSKDDVSNISNIQQNLALINEKLNNKTSEMASRRSRMENISLQMAEEQIRFKELKTINEDTDYAKTTMNLKLEEMALQYTLQIGSRLMQTTLMDFLK